MVDLSKRTVSLDDIVFDTFGGSPRYVPLSIADDELIVRLMDAIEPILQPVYGDVDALPWLKDEHLVMGYLAGGGAYAYPVNILNFHEIVNDDIGGQPLLVTYCPLCFSGIVFDRVVDGEELTFGNTSALYQSDMVMYDHQTGSYWFQVGGEAVVGTLAGRRLKLLPSTVMEWRLWKSLHPDTRLLAGTASSPDKFASSKYARDISSGLQDRVNREEFVFPVSKELLDPRLPAGEIVLVVEASGSTKAYPLDQIVESAVNDEIGGEPVVLLSLNGNRGASAFSPLVQGRKHTFEFLEGRQAFADRETGSIWNLGGKSISGPHAGFQLDRLNTRRAFWFSVATAFPGIDLYEP